jgi:hypothetical protein
MKTTRTITHVWVSLIIWASFIGHSFALVPAFGPNPGDNAWGIFAEYFERFANNPCTTGTGVLTGVSNNSTDFLKWTCTDIADILANFLGRYPVQSGKGVIGFNATTWEPLFWNVGSPTQSWWYLTGNLNTDPAINFVGTTDAQGLRFRTNNVERLSITSMWSVGIGTNAPINELDVIGAIRSSSGIITTSSIISKTATPALYLNDTDSKWVILYTGTNKFSITGTNSGWTTPDANPSLTLDLLTRNVGIGMSSPLMKLDVAGFIRSSSGIISKATIPTLYLHDTDSKWVALYTGNNKFHLGSTPINSTTTTGTPPLTVDLISGNVGIGTIAPSFNAKLEVAWQIKITGGTPGVGKVLRSDANGLATWVTTGSIMTESDPRWTAQKWLYATLSGPQFTGDPKAPTRVAWDNDTSIATTAFVTTANSTKANIASPNFTGNPTAPTPALTDNDTTIATTRFVKSLGYITASGVTAAETDPQVWTIDLNYIPKWNGSTLVSGTITDNGWKIWIGVASPTEKVEVAGNVRAIAFMYTSDKRLKKNITPIKDIDEILMSLNWVKFEWKDTGKKDIGFIAQDVEKILPELVHTGNDTMKSVEYANITALLVEGYKYQKARADDLEKRIEKLEQSIK